MPTSGHGDDDVEEMYEQIDEIIKLSNGKDNMIIIGYWNAVVGEINVQGISGAFGLGKRNQRGEGLLEFCKEQNLVITNTLSSQPKRRRYT